jgi:two-component system OmpR family sensor kinase
VTNALRTIAAADFSPRRLLAGSSDLQELTGAYNDVAYSLATATAQRDKTEAQMRQFIADAGHELRTPLTIIMGYLDALRHGIVIGGDSTQQTYTTMLDESRKMRALIDKLILLARLERTPCAPLGPVDLSKIARQGAQAIAPVASDHNALKYAPESDVDVRVSRGGATACIEIADCGPGMDPQDVAHAFDRFYRGSARGQTEGSGLGLAIAKTAFERAGGSARIDSAPGHGTRVRLCCKMES